MANYITGLNDVLVNNINRWEAHADEQTSYYWSVTGTQDTDWVEVSQGNTGYFYDVKFLNSGSYTISCNLVDLGLSVEKNIQVYGKLDKVPNTNTFSLKDVCNVVLDSLYGNLNNCFALAESTYFNISYSGSKDRLSNFRDYTPSGLSINPFILEWDYLSTIQKYTQVTLDPDSTITVTASLGDTSHWTFSINQSLNRVYFTPTTIGGGSIAILAGFIISAGAEYPNRTIQLVHAANECFVEGTLITLPSGEQTKVENLVEEQSVQSALIEDLNTNNIESLLSWNKYEFTYDKLSTKVKSNKSRVVHETIIINNGLIEATAEHIQLIKSSNVWKLIRFKDIKEGDKLYTIDEKLIEITSIEINNKPRTVYKLSLYDPYMYYANNILTHNIKQ